MDQPATTGAAVRLAEAGAAPLRAALVGIEQLDHTDLAAWAELAERAAEPNPFFRPEFVLAAVTERNEPTCLLVVRRGADWVACLPLQRRRRWRKLPLPCLAPWLESYAFLGTPLVRDDSVAEAASVIAGWFAAQWRVLALVLDRQDPDGPILPILLAAFSAHGSIPVIYERSERAALRRRSQSTYLDGLGAKRRKELRRLHRRLGEELGGALAVVDRAGDPAAHEAFVALEQSGWKGQAGTALGSRCNDAAFFRRMCAGMAASGRLQLLALQGGGRVAAMQCNLLEPRAMFAFKVAYDPSLARFSPGVLLEVEAIGVFHDSLSAAAADSCAAPGSATVERLWPDRRRILTAIVPRNRRTARILRVLLAAEASARAIVRRGRARRGSS